MMPKAKEKLKLVTVKTTALERKRLKLFAEKYTRGNVSEWIKRRALPVKKKAA